MHEEARSLGYSHSSAIVTTVCYMYIPVSCTRCIDTALLPLVTSVGPMCKKRDVRGTLVTAAKHN